MEESTCLIIQNIDESITQELIDQSLREIAINCQTSMPDQIQLISALGTAYAVFPSKEAAKKILYKLEGNLDLGNLKFPIEFYPSSIAKNNKQMPQTLAKDVNLVQDWICDKCDYKNFARRIKCYKCENPRNQNCRVVYNSACIIRPNFSSMHMQTPPTAIDTAAGANTSLMVRGNVLFEISETMLLDIFSKIAPVKDIRMVKNKNTGQMRDFAFIEFYTIDEAEAVLKMTQSPDFKINGQTVTVAFSKSRKRDVSYENFP
jgi:RNA-binding protein 5/10